LHSNTGASDNFGLDVSYRFSDGEGEETAYQKKMAALKLGYSSRPGDKDGERNGYTAEELAGLELDFGVLDQHQGAGTRDTLAAANNAKKYEFADDSSDDDGGELTERSEKANNLASDQRASF